MQFRALVFIAMVFTALALSAVPAQDVTPGTEAGDLRTRRSGSEIRGMVMLQTSAMIRRTHKMARLVGVDLPREKRVEIALTYIFGVGRTRAKQALAGIHADLDWGAVT